MLNKIRSRGFVFVEFAIALPLLILLMYGLGNVSVKIFELGKIQLADYVLEEEAQYVMERITHLARAAKEIKPLNDSNSIKIVYHAVDNSENFYTFNGDEPANRYWLFSSEDVWETQFILAYKKDGRDYTNLYAVHRNDIPPSNPITGENFFGDTQLVSLQCELDESKKILHIELVMASLVTNNEIKIATAVFMPGLEVP
ncbi:MAG: hypothetical protein IKT98_00955 [Selenomonadaceae bacterium]|nr:hypothetical protein [Selenomonadaceae bacterium]